MNKWLTLLLLTLLYIPVYSQSETTYIPYVAYWEVGDEYNFSVSKVKEQWKEDNRIKLDSSTYNAQFKVLQATDSSYLISWTFENQLPPELNLPESLKEQIAGFTNMQVSYETDELGTFVGVQNWEEISLKTQALFNEVIKLTQDVPDSDISNEKLEAAMAPFISIYSSKEGIERLVLGELQYFHYPMGAEFAVKDTLHYQDLLPNMFGGTPIRGDARIYFEEVDLENSTSLMIQQMTLNPEDTKNTLLDVFKRMNLEENEIEKALANSEFNITDINKYEFYFYPCVPIKIETKRTSIINIDSEKGKRIDRTIIKLID
ncbi:hypothetical protein BFP97_00695 [Roseivirga sp. 4D4]|uniref:hypothetical protein n=1 Tax=Roseivirga sp. 4D4 TaxID=1889784 RepID=UPI000853A954|nr:hypothetical protein [Roseivirga sp. 4D4]OEK00121.1 hypothetical protein BFP97_00695 [Roseivirga sp. 4D4]